MNCRACGKELKPVEPGFIRRRTDYPHYEGALVIELHGGYGMYFDDMTIRLVLCNDCATQLVTGSIVPLVGDVFQIGP